MKTAKHLAHDFTRCHDAHCNAREHCLRWLERDMGDGLATPHAPTLRPPWQRNEGLCDNAISAGPDDADADWP